MTRKKMAMSQLVALVVAVQAFINVVGMLLLWMVVNTNEPPTPITNINYVVHNLILDPTTLTVTQIRTSNVYPVEVFFEARVVDNITDKEYCSGKGSATIDEKPDNTAGPYELDDWVKSTDCPVWNGENVALVATWYWNDIDGSAQSLTFRSEPTRLVALTDYPL